MLSDVDPSLPDCSSRRGSLAVDAIAGAVRRCVEPLRDSEVLPLRMAIGRVLAEAIKAPIDLPAFDHSAVDGYALGAEAAGQPVLKLPVSGRVKAGHGRTILPISTALRVLTGAPIPEGCSAVVMQEHVRRTGETIEIDDAVRPGVNIRRRGEDVPQGETVLPAGCWIDARHVALLAALGVAAVEVVRPVRVVTIAFGDELRAPGGSCAFGQIYDSNSALTAALFSGPSFLLEDALQVGDDPHDAAHAVRSASEVADLIVTSGGMSDGDEDHTRRAVEAAGGSWSVLAVRMKPGKPAGIGRIGTAAILGLPGNPFAALVALLLIGRPIVGTLTGREISMPAHPARAGFSLERRPGRTEIFPARLVGHTPEGAMLIDRVSKGGSARLRPLLDADGLGRIEAECIRVQPGDRLSFMPFAELLSF